VSLRDPWNSPLRLRVMAILQDAPTAEMMARVMSHSSTGDQLRVATDLAEGLARTVAEAPDIALIDVSLGNNAGLAVVHYLRSVAPDLVVYALARADALDLGAQALALGGAGLLTLPLNGDELLTLLGQVRTRLAERAERRRLERVAAWSERGATLVARVAEISHARNRRDAAEQLARVLVQHAGLGCVLVYLPAGGGSRQLMRTAAAGQALDAPAFCEQLELLEFANSAELEVLRLTLRHEEAGILLLGGILRDPDASEPLPFTDLLAAQAATALALIGEREQAHRGAMKDPTSSAYTFGYFVDVAGREIDKARRHGRRFALATIAIADDVPEDVGVQVVERTLGTVRDTDILARVDEREFYLLLPETGGIGAHVCRRRILRQLLQIPAAPSARVRGLDVTVGVATFPHDGRDLSQLLRVAKHRAERAHHSMAGRRDLESRSLGELLDAYFGDASDLGVAALAPRVIEMPAIDLVTLACTALGEARRGGTARVVVTHRPGVSLSAAVHAVFGRDLADAEIHVVDVSAAPDHADLEALAIVAEHGAYALLARVEGNHARLVHAADPLLVDLVALRLGEIANLRLAD
jgi:GGDEF domain-containing protein/DNA-binding response OmpR family regulator